MQKALNEVLGGEYKVVIQEELSKLKQSDRMLLGEPCAVLYRTDANLGRPIEECGTEEKSCYIVFLPSKYSIICNKDFGALRNKDSKVKLVSLNYFVEQVLEFNFTFLQLIEQPAVLFSTAEFDETIRKIKNSIETTEEVTSSIYTKLASTAFGAFKDLKSGKIKDESSRLNRLFMVYKICETCKQMNLLSSYRMYDSINLQIYREVVKSYRINNFSTIENLLDDINNSGYNSKVNEKALVWIDKLQMKYEVMHDLIIKLLEEN